MRQCSPSSMEMGYPQLGRAVRSRAFSCSLHTEGQNSKSPRRMQYSKSHGSFRRSEGPPVAP